MAETKTYSKKVVLLGDGAVGKTSLINQFVEKRFGDAYIKTIGANCKKKELDYPKQNLNLNLMIYDLVGQQGYKVTQKANMSGANSAIMVCDITRPETAESLENYWIPLIKEVSTKTPPLTFLINKSDLLDAESGTARKTCGEILKLANIYESKMYITSAKNGANVEQAFRDVGLLSLNFEPEEIYEQDIYRTGEQISPIEALDRIQQQFYTEMGGSDFANNMLKKMIIDFGIDVNDGPNRMQLEKIIERIKELETAFIPEKDIRNYYIKRRGLLAKLVA